MVGSIGLIIRLVLRGLCSGRGTLACTSQGMAVAGEVFCTEYEYSVLYPKGAWRLFLRAEEPTGGKQSSQGIIKEEQKADLA